MNTPQPAQPTQPVAQAIAPPVPPNSSEPIVAPVEPTQPKKSPLIAIMAVLLIITTAAAAYFYSQSRTPTLTTQPQPTVSTPPSASADPTADWQTYSNPIFDFSFKHPPGYSIVDNLQTNLDPLSWTTHSTLQLTNDDLGCSINLMINPDGFGPFFPNKLHKLVYSHSQGVYISSTTPNTENLTAGQYNLIGHGTIDVGNMNGIFVSAGCPDNEQSRTYLDHTLTQILSTFQFTETNNTLLPSPPPGSTRFISEELGVTFFYASEFGDESYTSEEVSSKVYVYNAAHNLNTGQYVEVFDKDPTDTLIDAINKTILEGYSLTNCIATISTSSPNIIARIKLPSMGNSDINMEILAEEGKKCPQPYAAYGGQAYFMMDPNYPTKFAFFSIGQYAIMGDDTQTWQKTFQFID